MAARKLLFSVLAFSAGLATIAMLVQILGPRERPHAFDVQAHVAAAAFREAQASPTEQAAPKPPSPRTAIAAASYSRPAEAAEDARPSENTEAGHQGTAESQHVAVENGPRAAEKASSIDASEPASTQSDGDSAAPAGKAADASPQALYLLELRGKIGSPLSNTVFAATPQDREEVRQEFLRQLQEWRAVPRPDAPIGGDSQAAAGARSPVETLRDAADELDRLAQQLERQDLFASADCLRDAARELRRAARSRIAADAAKAADAADAQCAVPVFDSAERR